MMMHIVVGMARCGVDSDLVVVKNSPLSAMEWEEWFSIEGYDGIYTSPILSRPLNQSTDEICC